LGGMPRALKLRKLSPEESDTIEKLARSRTAAARLAERARLLLLANQGHRVPAIASQLQLPALTVRTGLKRFNAAGLAALTDKARTGRPATYTPPQVAAVLATSLTPPEQLGLPFASWTLARLEAYLHDHKAIAIKRRRIDDLLIAAGLRWRTQAPWFGERGDPAFAKKRGALRNAIRPHLKVGS
jgi:transposase